MSFLKIRQSILGYLYRYLNKPNHVDFSIEDKNIQLLECHLGEARLKHLLTSVDIRTLIDVGASHGDFMNLVQQAKKNIHIYGFEPIPKVFNSLQQRFVGANEIELYNLALGNFDGVVDFNENDYSYSSSILPIGEIHVNEFPHTSNFKKLEVQITTLDSVFNNKKIERPLLVKVDVQGYEEQVISGGKNTFAHADIVIIEVSFYELYLGQALFERINRELNSLGLFYYGCISQLSSPIDCKILQQDALFIRRK
jgi:FkbM family methyltransferase